MNAHHVASWPHRDQLLSSTSRQVWGRSGSRPGGSEGPRSCLGSSQAIGHSVILVTAPSNEALVKSFL
jgi:hypothetical protein